MSGCTAGICLFIKIGLWLSSMLVQKQIFVSGRVQGVFFRESTRQMARQFNLAGGVRNLSDGRVEVQVAGHAESVHSLIKWLKIGPKLAKVSTIEVMDLELSEQASGMLPASLMQSPERKFDVWATDQVKD